MKTITFYSYKGGVGRSLALSNVANRLSEFGKKVCIMDFDLEAPGLHLKFGNYIKKEIRSGLVDYIHHFSEKFSVPSDINKYVTEVDFGDTDRRRPISLIAAGDTTSKKYWNKVCSIDWKKFFYEQDSVGVEFFYNLKEQIRQQIKPDFLLVDSRTGITDISGVTMSIMADEVVLLAANNRENLEGITQINKTLLEPENSISGTVPKINFVLSRIPYFRDPKDKPRETNAKNAAMFSINKDLKENGYDFKLSDILMIHSDQELELEETFKISHKFEADNAKEQSITGLDYLNLFEELTEDVISESERSTFDRFMKVEALVQKAAATKDFANRIQLLEEALTLEPNSRNVLGAMGIAYFLEKNYEKSLDYFEKASPLDNSSSPRYRVYQGVALINLGMYENALRVYKSLIELVPDEPYILNQLAATYYLMGSYDQAMGHIQKVLEKSPEQELAWNLYANILRKQGNFEEAMNAIYRALEIDPQSKDATDSLAEIYAEIGNDREFYKNLELAFSFGMDSEQFQRVLQEEDVYERFYNDERFLSILEKYNIELDWDKILKIRSRK